MYQEWDDAADEPVGGGVGSLAGLIWELIEILIVKTIVTLFAHLACEEGFVSYS